MMPLIGALDANHDGVIDADEIKNAAAALAKLDKNGDGQLTREEFMGRPPGRPDGPPPGDAPDRPRKDSRLDNSDRPPFPPDREAGEFRPSRERGPDAQGGPGHAPSPKELVEKFDANKDGKLDASELAAFLKDMREHRPPPLAGGPRPGGPPPEDAPPR